MTAAAVPARHACLSARMSAELTGRLAQYTPRLSWDPSELAACQRERLRVLLAHAAEHSPFHARRLRGMEVSHFEVDDLARLPVMTKVQMMARFDEVVTDRQLGRRLAEQHLAASAHRAGLLLDEYVCLVSGGSSGLRGALRQAGLSGPQVTLTVAEAVPRDSRTGKVRRFIPLPGQPPG